MKRCLGKRPALFKSGQWHFHEDNTPVHNSILVTDYLTKMGIKTVPHPPYSPELAPCDFCLFPKLRGCRYETIEEMKEAVTKVIDTLTQENFHGAFQNLLERYNKYIAVHYLEGDYSFISTEKDIDTRLTKAWTAIDRLSIIWKSDLTDKMKRSFFQAAVVSILLYGCTTWTLTKRLERRLDGNYTRMLRAVLNKSWRQHPTRLQLYGHLPPITKTIQVRRTRHAGHCWRSKDEFISDVLLWTPTHGCARVGRPARTYIQQLCEDTGCNPEDLPEAMNDSEKWRETVRDIRAGGAT